LLLLVPLDLAERDLIVAEEFEADVADESANEAAEGRQRADNRSDVAGRVLPTSGVQLVRLGYFLTCVFSLQRRAGGGAAPLRLE
jgi:hypothetical protein